MPEGSYRFGVGSIACTVLTDGYFSYPTQWCFPTADPDEVRARLERRRMPVESVLSPYTCLLIETGRHVVIVDTGAGAGARTTGALAARLEMCGIRPRDVDTVVLTHAHPDHIGGVLTAAGRPAFPNARHVLSERELEFWTARCTDLSPLAVPPSVQHTMKAVACRALNGIRYQVETIAGDAEIVPGVRALSAPGHTPGHLAVVLQSEGQTLLHMADAALHPLHLERPEWANGLDLDAAGGAATRRTLAARASSEKMHLMAFHFPFPSVGRLAALADGGWEWLPGWQD